MAAPIIKSLLTITIGAAVVLQLVNLKTSGQETNKNKGSFDDLPSITQKDLKTRNRLRLEYQSSFEACLQSER